MPTLSRLSAALLVQGLWLAQGSWAQSQPSPQTPPQVPTPSELAPRPAPPATDPAALPPRDTGALPREIPRPSGQLRLDVRAFEVAADAPAALREALPRITAPYVGPGRGYDDLAGAVAAVTRFLQSELGFYLGHAYLPEQAPRDGVVRIAVLEGRLDRIEIDAPEDSPVRPEVIERHLAALRPGEILLVRKVERAVLLVNDLRGIVARFEFAPGATAGTARLRVLVQAQPRWSARAEADVNGSRFLGRTRLGGGVTVASPLGRGDGLSLSALASTTGGLKFVSAGYTAPLGGSGLKAGASLGWARYRFDDEQFPLGLTGWSVTAGANLLYPVVRSRALNVFAIGTLEHKRYADRQEVLGLVTRKSADTLSIGSSGSLHDDLLGGASSTYDASATVGRMRFEEGQPPAEDDRDFRRASFALSRLQGLVDRRLQAYASLRGQWSFSNLDSTEQFRLGGPDGVRAFAPGEGAGDSGVLLSAELRWLLPAAPALATGPADAVLGAFYDVGRIRRRHDPSRSVQAGPNSASFSGAGISLGWAMPGRFGLRASLAWPLHGTPTSDTAPRRPRLYLQASLGF